MKKASFFLSLAALASFMTTYTAMGNCSDCTRVPDTVLCVCSPGRYLSFRPGFENNRCCRCPMGRHMDESEHLETNCKNCPQGHFQGSRGQAQCRLCEVGQFQDDVGSQECKLCSPGRFAHWEGQTHCRDCPSGQISARYEQSDFCIRCQAGRYNDQTRQTSCKQCDPGTFNRNTGQTGCKQCDPGTFNDQTGRTSCKQCDPGTFNNQAGKTGCKQCAAGTFNDQTGQTSCKKCDPGTFNNQAGQTICRRCGTGRFSSQRGQTSCKECNSGRFNDQTEQTVCRRCGTGRFSRQRGQTGCRHCQAGRYNDQTGRVSCKTCDPGRFNGQTGQTSQNSCRRCPRGKFASGTGNSGCRDCSTGQYQNDLGNSNCIECDTGKFNDQEGEETGESCQVCPRGHLAAGTGNSQCRKCSTGEYQDNEGKSSCKPCREGKYNDQKGKTTESSCTNCPSGQFAPSSGSSQCSACGPGQYQDTWGKTSCKDCPVGRAESNDESAQCSKCSPGKYQDEVGNKECKLCELGRHGNEQGTTNCIDCSLGRFAPTEGNAQCTKCTHGQFQITTGETKCIECLRGKFAPGTGNSQCIDCFKGQYQNTTGNAECKQCETGQFNNQTGQINCKLCPQGEFADETGSTSCAGCPKGRIQDEEGTSECIDCSEGKFQPSTGKTECIRCSPGQFSDERRADSCRVCKAGEFSSDEGGSRCRVCVIGQFGANEGATECQSCPVGKFQNENGQENCVTCSVGYYSANQSAWCSPCGLGKYSDQPGAATCRNCDVGKYNNQKAQTRCLACKEGQFANDTGASTCEACSAGTFQHAQGTSRCLECSQGEYQPLTGKTTCIRCPRGKYNDERGRTSEESCTLCEIGKFATGTGNSRCMVCAEGQFGTTEGSSECITSQTNGSSRLGVSACGALKNSDCVSINYRTIVAVDDVRNGTFLDDLAYINLSNTSTITVQSVKGILPSLEILCGLDVYGGTLDPVDCLDQSSLGRNGIPFFARYEVLSNRSCLRRNTGSSCRIFVFVTNVHMLGNVSNSKVRLLTEQGDGSFTMYAMTISVISEGETLISMRQRIRIPVLDFPNQGSKDTPIDVSIFPSTISKTIHRDQDTPPSFNVSIQLGGRSDLNVSWIFPSRLSQFMKTPRTKAIASNLFPARLAIRNQKVPVETSLLSHGMNTGTVKIIFKAADEFVATMLLDVNLTVLEGDIRLRQSSFVISRSPSEGPTSRAILLANEGDKNVQWTGQTIRSQSTNQETSQIPWLSFLQGGSLSPCDESSLSMELSPQLVDGLGAFEAWILIETDSWTGDSQNLDEEFGELVVPHFDTADVSFWVHVRFIVRSIFVCQQFAPVTTILPNELNVLPLRLINIVSKPITVVLRNFSISSVGNESVAILTDSDLINRTSIYIEETIVNGPLRLTPWWTVSPPRLALQPATSGGFHMKIGYNDRDLKPQELKAKFVLEVFFGAVTNSPDMMVPTDFVIAFGIGVATPGTSYVAGNGTEGDIGDLLYFVVKLLDVFGHGPATAMFDSELTESSGHKQLPVLTIITRPSDVKNVIGLQSYSKRGAVTELLFGLDLRADGQVDIDVKLGNVSIVNSPVTVVSNAVQCGGNSEIPNLTGTLCLCKSGHYRTETGRCIPCPPGTFLPLASNRKSCLRCAKDSFAETGESTCHACAGSGIRCHEGIVSMKNGYWCETCQQLEVARASVLDEIRRGNDEIFHECVPPESCIVNSTLFTSKCASGYVAEGPVCDTCKSGYVKVASGECLPCANNLQDLTLTILGAVLIIVAIAIITVLSYRDVMSDVLGVPPSSPSGETSQSSKGPRFNEDTCSVTTLENPLFTNPRKGTKTLSQRHDRSLKRDFVSLRHIVLLMVDYFQIAFIIHAMEISPFTLNSEWMNAVSAMATLTPAQAGAVQCTMDSDPFQASLTTIISPVALIVCVLFFQILTTLYQTKCKCPFPWTTLMASFARSVKLVMNLIHMSVTNATLQVFAVHPIKIGSSERASLDLTMETSSSNYILLRNVAIASLIVVVIGYPLFTIVYYLRVYLKAKTPEALKQLSKMSGGFKTTGMGFLWESVVIIRKVALLLVVSFAEGPVNQLISASMTLIISVFFLAFLTPYKKQVVTYLQYTMILICFITLVIGFLMRVYQDERDGQRRAETLSNVVFVLQITLLLIVLIAKISLAPKAVERLRIILANKLPICKMPCSRAANRKKHLRRRNKRAIPRSPGATALSTKRLQHDRPSLPRLDSLSFSKMVLHENSHRPQGSTQQAQGEKEEEGTKQIPQRLPELPAYLHAATSRMTRASSSHMDFSGLGVARKQKSHRRDAASKQLKSGQ